MIRHLVLVRFAANTDRNAISALMDELGGLRAHLPGISDFGHAPNISPETNVTHGFSHLFWFDFEDEAARDAYLDAPAHKVLGQELVAMAQGGTLGLVVCDYTS